MKPLPELNAMNMALGQLREAYWISVTTEATAALCFAVLTFAGFLTLRSLTQWLNAKTRTEELKQQQIQWELEGKR